MQTQLVNYDGRNENNYSVTECNSFGQAHSLDSYDLNIIDLTSSSIWLNHCYNKDFETLECDNDFQTLLTSVYHSSKTKFLYILPPNIRFKTEYTSPIRGIGKDFLAREQLKDIIRSLVYNLKKVIPIDIDLYYEKTHTNLSGIRLSADFYLNSEMGENYYDGYNPPEDMVYSDGS